MQKVVIVNLNGNAYHLEEEAYASLGTYLERAEAHMRDNPDRREIVADLEQAIADKCSRYLGPGKNVVMAADMATILDEMGPVHDESADAGAPHVNADTHSTPGTQETTAGSNTSDDAHASSSSQTGTAPRRLYRLLETGVLGGVCSGLATFWDIDVTIVRIGVVVLTLLELAFLHSPFMLLAYLAALFIVPAADTSEERAAARGIPFSAQQLIDEAKRNFSHIGDRDWTSTRRQWRQQRRWERKYQRQMRRAHAWTAAPPATYGAQVALGFTTPLATLLSVAAFWALAYAALALANTGAVLGWPLPAGIPLWVGLLGLLLVYNALIWPLHLWRRVSYYRIAGPEHAHYHAFDGLMSVVAGIAIVWAAYHYRPEVRDWLQHLPEAWNNVVASFRGSGGV